MSNMKQDMVSGAVLAADLGFASFDITGMRVAVGQGHAQRFGLQLPGYRE